MQHPCPVRKTNSGFTLIELMIVIAIIGILAAIAIPQCVNYLNTAKAQDVAADMTLISAVLPAVFSCILFFTFWRQAKDQRLIIAFLLFAVTIGLATQYWGVLGLHLFTGSLIVWPILALLQGDNFRWPLAYPLAFINTVFPDMYGAGMAAH